MRLRQNHFVPPIPLLIASEVGLPEEMELDITVTTGSAHQLRALLDDEADLAVTAIDNLFEWTRAGADLRLIAQVEKTVTLGIYAGAEFSSLTDLAGRRFSVDAYANGYSVVARHVLTSAGVQVDYVEQGGARERLQALLAGQADAALLAPPFDAIAADAGKRRLASVTELIPDFPGQGLVVRADRVESEALVRYLRALDGAVTASASMSDDAGVALLRRNGVDSGASAVWAARPRTLSVDPAGLAVLTGIRESLGLLPADVDLASLHDPGPLLAAMS